MELIILDHVCIGDDVKRVVFDNITDSKFFLSDAEIENIKKRDNCSVLYDSTQITFKNILVIGKNRGMYKIVYRGDNVGEYHIIYSNDKDIEELVGSDRVMNYSKEKGISLLVDLEVDKDFKDKVDKEYEIFKTKNKILGKDFKVDYTIEGKNVILIDYKGNSDTILIPNFINTIRRWAILETGVQKIILGKNTKYIARESILSCMDIDIEGIEHLEVMFEDSIKNTYTNGNFKRYEDYVRERGIGI